MDDETLRIGRQQVARIDAGLAQANAEFQQAKVNGDEESAGLAMQTYADLEAQKLNLLNAYDRQIAAEQTAAPRQLTREQINKMDLNEMSPEIRKWWFSQQSKHGQDSAAYDAGEAFVRQNPVRR